MFETLRINPHISEILSASPEPKILSSQIPIGRKTEGEK